MNKRFYSEPVFRRKLSLTAAKVFLILYVSFLSTMASLEYIGSVRRDRILQDQINSILRSHEESLKSEVYLAQRSALEARAQGLIDYFKTLTSKGLFCIRIRSSGKYNQFDPVMRCSERLQEGHLFSPLSSRNLIIAGETIGVLEVSLRTTPSLSDIFNKNILMAALLSLFAAIISYHYLIRRLLATVLSPLFDHIEEQAKSSALVGIANQVSHDIRSPLSALNMITASFDSLPEERRILARNAIQRINDIANDLLAKGRSSIADHIKTDTEEHTVIENIGHQEWIPELVDILVSEKRLQHRDNPQISIEADLRHCNDAFANISGVELKRVLSNLINNSIEAIPNLIGFIIVAVRSGEKDLTIFVQDNGKGMPESILNKLGEKEITYGKENSNSGSGLGIFHAKTTIEMARGQIDIRSKEKVGTFVTIRLPKVDPPFWFISRLIIQLKQTIVILDDDISIHQVWRDRIKSSISNSSGLSSIKIVNFSSGQDFSDWVREHHKSLSLKPLYLVDFELVHQEKTGLDLIVEHCLSEYAILVSSRYNEESILQRAKKINLKMIPKSMACLIPIQISTTK